MPKKLAKLLFKASSHLPWQGGVAMRDMWERQFFPGKCTELFAESNWPKEVEVPYVHYRMDRHQLGLTHWSLGPEVVIAGMALRLAILSRFHYFPEKTDHPPRNAYYHNYVDVVVFVDNEIKYPGGGYTVSDFLNPWPWNGSNWAIRIARQRVAEGVKRGLVYSGARQKLIDNLERTLEGKPVESIPAEDDPEYLAALSELDAELAKRGG